VLQNCTSRSAMRQYLSSGTRPPSLQSLAESLHRGTPLRRRGVAHVIRNVCLDERTHVALLQSTICDAVVRRLFSEPAEDDRDARDALYDALLALTKSLGGVSKLRELKLVRCRASSM
jgi:hypothetical protein